MNTENKYINKISKADLKEFIGICKNLNFDFDENLFELIVSNTIKYLNCSKENRVELRYMQSLEKKWYDSIKSGIPDYSVYDDVYYLADTWVCWKIYSRSYIKAILSDKSIAIKDKIGGPLNKIADLGCGIGYTSAALKQEFNCNVFGTNIKNTKQYEVCNIIAAFEGFTLVESLEEIGTCDLVFASEYFEHFERPIEHLKEVIKILKPKHFIFANTFNAKSIGHFDIYKHLSENYSGKQISRMFSKTLKELNYRKINTNFWNNRPNYYQYEE